MSSLEHVIRQLEDLVLAEKGLFGKGKVPFEYRGETVYGFPYIRSQIDSFEQAMLSCAEWFPESKVPIRFLEVGCGIGTKCEVARWHGMCATGLDVLGEYVQLAQQVFPDCAFVVANALEFDYGEYDLVYYHVPFSDDVLLNQLEQRILTQLPVHGVLCVTRFSGLLHQSLFEEQGLKPCMRPMLAEPEIDAGRLRALQKTAAFTAHVFDGNDACFRFGNVGK